VRGQSLVELALTLPVVLLLALGTAAAVRVADARSGLDAATAAAAAAAARQPDVALASAAARGRFQAVAAAYPLRGPALSFDGGAFDRGGSVLVHGEADVDLTWAPFPGLPAALHLTSTATAAIEPWRSRAS
jgi:Flp pilus assembly protein TadG